MQTAKPWNRPTIDQRWWAQQCRGQRANATHKGRREAEWMQALEPRVLLSAGPQAVQVQQELPAVNVLAFDAEASEAGDTGSFSFTRSGDTDQPLNVAFLITGEAISGTDYQTIAQSVTFEVGQSTAELQVQPINDNLPEGTERVIVQLQGGEAYVVGDSGSATVNIADNDTLATTQVNVTATDATAAEGGQGGQFTFTRTGDPADPLTVSFVLSGEAQNGGDYETLQQTVQFDAGQATATLSVDAINDDAVEGNERLILQLVSSSNYVAGDDSSAVIDIIDNETAVAPQVNIVASDPDATESGDPGQFTITRTGLLDEALTVTYNVTGTATSGTDYQTLSGTVQIPAGASSVTLDVTPVDDDQQEADETVIVQLAPGGETYVVGQNGSATVTLSDDETPPGPQVTLTATDAAANESGDTGAFTVTRIGSTDGDLVVQLTIAGTATNGADFRTVPATVTIPNGQATATITVTPIDDTDVEGDETVQVSVAASDAYTIGGESSGTVTIGDNNQQPQVTLSVTDAQVNESGGTAAMVVTRTGNSQQELVVQLSIGGTATNGTDYDTIPATVTIPAGASTATINVAPINDALVEGNETILVTVLDDAAYDLGQQVAGTVTIVDDELGLPEVTIVAADAEADESGSTGAFTVTRTGSTDGELVISLSISGTANNEQDYTSIPSTVTIPAGQSSTTINVTPIADQEIEEAETVILTLQDAQTYTIGDANSALVTLSDDPGIIQVAITATDPVAFEPGDTGTFTVTRTGSTDQDLVVQLQVTGTANNGEDYESIPATVTIPAGQTTVAVTVNTLEDELVEGDESVIVTLQQNDQYVVSTQSSATVTIVDGDTPVVISIASNDNTAAEGGDTGTFTITRTGSIAQELVVALQVTGTATNGTDYQTIPATVTIPAGQATADLTVVAQTDGTVEGDETVILTLADGQGYTVGQNNSATVTITDVNDVPVITIAATDASAGEAGDPGTFVITRTGSTAQDLTFNFVISGTATNGTDYQTLTSSAVIAAGQSTATVTVTPVEDNTFEGDETVVLTLAADSAYTLGAADDATVTIQDNDQQGPTVTITATDSQASEAGDGAVFTITRSQTNGQLVVNYVVTGTAANGVDYQTLTGTATIAAGQTSVEVPITIVQDNLVEGQETVTVTVIGGTGYNVDDNESATAFIADDEPGIGDLAVTFADDDLAQTLVPGQRVRQRFVITNTGDQDLRERANFQVFLLPLSQELPGQNDQPVFSREQTLRLNQGRTRNVATSFVVPDTLEPGEYRLVAVLDPTNEIPETNVQNNVVRSAPTDVALSFGDVDGRRVRSLTVNGVRYILAGEGTGTVVRGQNGQPDSILLQNTNERSKLTMVAPRNAGAQVQNIDIQGSLAQVNSRNVNVLGNVNSTGTLGRFIGGNFVGGQQTINIQGTTADRRFDLRTGNVRNLSVNSGIPVGQLVVVDWLDDDSEVDRITAPSVNRLVSRGDFQADLNLSDTTLGLNRADVRGALADSVIRSAGGINTVRAGIFSNSSVFAGMNNNLGTLPTVDGDFTSASRIGTVQATGIRGDSRPSFANSRIAASELGNVRLRDVTTANQGQPFGIAAGTSIGSFRRDGVDPQRNLTSTGAFDTAQDFRGIII